MTTARAVRSSWTCSIGGSGTFRCSRPPDGCSASSRTTTSIAAENTTSFHLRHAVARASSVDELVRAASKLRPTVVGLTPRRDARARRDVGLLGRRGRAHPAGPRPRGRRSGRTARALHLARAGQSSPARGVAEFGPRQRDRLVRSRRRRDAAYARLLRCGRDRRDGHAHPLRLSTRRTPRQAPSDPLFVRSLASWQREAHSFLDDPTQEKALVLVSVLVDSRPVWGVESEPLIADTFRTGAAPTRSCCASSRTSRSRTSRRSASSGDSPSTSRARAAVDSTSRAARVVPITDLARWAGMAAGVTCASTTARLERRERRGYAQRDPTR